MDIMCRTIIYFCFNFKRNKLVPHLPSVVPCQPFLHMWLNSFISTNSWVKIKIKNQIHKSNGTQNHCTASRLIKINQITQPIIWISWDARSPFINHPVPQTLYCCFQAVLTSGLFVNSLMIHVTLLRESIWTCVPARPGANLWKYLTYLTTSDWNLSSPLCGLFTGSCHLPLWC